MSFQNTFSSNYGNINSSLSIILEPWLHNCGYLSKGLGNHIKHFKDDSHGENA